MAGSTTSEATVFFATHALPIVIVIDNSSFSSRAFLDLMKLSVIKFIHSSPYHPSSNGLAEIAVKTFKNGMKITGDMQARL